MLGRFVLAAISSCLAAASFGLQASATEAVPVAQSAPKIVEISYDFRNSRGDSLNQSIANAMSADTKTVAVSLAPAPDGLPDDLAMWLLRVRSGGGQLYYQDLSKNPFLAAIVGAVVQFALDKAWAAYQARGRAPTSSGDLFELAKKYHAFIIFAPGKAGKDENARCVTKVEFVSKASPQTLAEAKARNGVKPLEANSQAGFTRGQLVACTNISL